MKPAAAHQQYRKSRERPFARLATRAAHETGRPWAFAVAALVIVVWLATGPVFHFSDTWQLVINTGTTIITFLMVFLIQHAQNRDSVVVQLKLDELIAAVEGASNRLIDLEDLTEDEIEHLRARFAALAREAKRLGGQATSVDAESNAR